MPVLFAHLATQAIEGVSNHAINSDPADQRSLWDILWSCAVTIFACTWIAVHPNIPAADDTLLVIGFRRAGLMLCGMVAPEIIILWAMRQWYSARKIGREHRVKGWTTTHGFFLQMGGFMMCDGKNPPYPIQLDDLVTRYAKGEIDWPEITEREIRDRSKGDAFSKGVVVFQTSWFLIQCIGRGAAGLAITELELVTLAFAALNAVTYFFWWDKPADVQCAHPVYLRGPTSRNAKYMIHSTQQSKQHEPRSLSSWAHLIWGWVRPIFPPFYAIYQRGSPFAHMFTYFQRPVMFLMKFLVRIVLPMTGKMNGFGSMKRVPTFYAARFESDAKAFFLMTLACAFIGSAFGGIHCIAWSFQFSSSVHQLAWRTSSLIITCAPLAIALASAHMSRQNHIYKRFITPLKYRVPVGAYTTHIDFPSHSDRTSLDFHAAIPQLVGSHPSTRTRSSLEPHAAELGSGAEDATQLASRVAYSGSGTDENATTSNVRSATPSLILPSVNFDSYTTMVLRTVAWTIKCVLLAGTTATYIAARVILVVQALMALKTLSPAELQDMKWTSFMPHV